MTTAVMGLMCAGFCAEAERCPGEDAEEWRREYGLW